MGATSSRSDLHFVVGGGRAARVVLGTVPGLSGVASIADCLERFDEAMGTDAIYIPPDDIHEVLYECEHIGLDLTAITG